MANNCNTALYYPEQFDIIDDLITFHPEAVEDYINTTYEPKTANKILEAIKRGEFDENWGVTKAPIIENPKDGKRLESDTIFSKPNTSQSVRSYFEGNQTGGDIAYNRVLKNFKNKVISLLIFNKDSKEGVQDPNNPTSSGLSLINERLYNYKMELAKELSDYLGLDGSWIGNTNLSDQEFTKNLWITLNRFELAKNTNQSNWSTHFESYVLLKNFDKLIKDLFDFVHIKKGFDEDIKSINMYDYTGGVAPQDINWGTEEAADISEYTSPLIKLLLDYLPEVSLSKNGVESDLETPITFTGFNRVMTKMRDYFDNADGVPDYLKAELDKGVSANWDRLINYYINILTGNDSSSQKINSNYKTILVNKLRGIQKYILRPSSNLSDNIKKTFLAQINKTVDTQYIVYRKQWNSNTKQYEIYAQNLHDDFVNVQSRSLQNAIRASLYRFYHNPKQFTDLLNKYGIEVKDNEIIIHHDSLNGKGIQRKLFKSTKNIDITKLSDKKYSFDLNAKQNFSDASDENVVQLIEDLLQINLPSDYKNYIDIIAKNTTLFDIFSRPLLFTLSAGNDTSKNKYEYEYQDEVIKTWRYKNDFSTAARYLGYIYGSDVLNVLRNSKGNNLPLYQLGSYVYDFKKLLREFKENYKSNTGNLIKAENVFKNNPLVADPNIVKRVYIRSEFNIGTKQKEARDLTFSEVMQLALVEDYYNNLYKENGNFLLQPIVYSDKRTHYLVEFDTNKIFLRSGTSLRNTLRNIGESFNTPIQEQQIIDYVAEYRKDKTKAQIINLIRRFNNALGWNLEVNKDSSWNDITNALDSILNEIKKNYPTVSQLRSLFKNAQLYEEFDIKTDKSGNITGFNETLLHNGEMYWNYNHRNPKTTELFNNRIQRERFQFAKDLWNSDFSLTALRDPKLTTIFSKLQSKDPTTFNKWYDSYSKTMSLFKIYEKGTKNLVNNINNETFDYTKYDIELNPILNSYYYAELTLSPAYSEILFGDVAGYPSKYKREENISDEDYFLFSEANRLTAQCKRTMAGGSTRHSYLQGTKYGVGSKVIIAEIDDPTGEIFNPLGEKEKGLALHDGGGWINPYYAIMENESLVDAAVAEDKKTIWTFTDKETGILTEIKWAAYALNNTRRRFSQSPADYSAEILFRKMNAIPIREGLTKSIDFNKFYDPTHRSHDNYDRKFTDYIYYWDQLNDVTWRIDYIDNQNGTAIIHETAVDKYGFELGQTRNRTQKITDLYSLDQIFGGAYAQTMNPELKFLEWSNRNTKIVANMIGVYQELKDNLVGYIVNHSAIKVGSRQINDLATLKDLSVPFKTFEMSTKFGGVQMDASHDVEYGHVSEMSQMISSLIQAGFSTDLVNQIYKDIGEVAKAGIDKLGIAIESGDKNKIYKILGKALIDSFNSTKRSGLGLTESFLVIAENALKQNNFKVKIPFSSPDVKNAFVTTVMAELNKSGIRRKYDGLAAVLTPSAGVMMYYNLPGVKGTLTYQEFVKALYNGNGTLGQKALNIRQKYIDIALSNGMTEEDGKLQFLKDIFNKVVLLGKYPNPTLIEPQSKSDLDFYDTVVYKKLNEDWSQAKTIRLDTISKYDYVKSHLDPSQYNFAIWTAKPKDLKFGYTKFTGIVGNQAFVFNDYDTDIVRSNFYLKDLKEYVSNIMAGKPDGSAITKVGLNPAIIAMSLSGVFPEKTVNTIFRYINEYDPTNPPSQAYTNLVLGTINTLIKSAEQRTQALYTALSDIQHGRPTDLKITVNGVQVDQIKDIEVQSGQIMLGKANASKLGLRPNDTIADVRAAGYRFFRDRIFEETGIPINVDESLFDAVGFTSDNKKVLISIGSFNENINRINKTFSSEDFREINGDIYYKDEELCKAQGKIFREYTTNDGQKYYFINIDSYDRLKELNRTEWFNTIRLNYNTHNWKKLLIAQNPDIFEKSGNLKQEQTLELTLPDTLDINGQLTLTPGGKYLIDKNLNDLDSNLLVNILRENEDDRYFNYVENLAQRKYQSFLNQLNYIAARIPTQSMQSFMPLEVVAFTDSTTNDVYVPRSLTWLEGADYDIDKEYMMGYSLLDNGDVPTLSALDKYKNYDIKELLRLPIPKNREFEINSDNAILVTLDDLKTFDKNLSVISRILKDGRTNITFEPWNDKSKLSEQTYYRLQKKLLKRLNEHEQTDRTGEYHQKALRNVVVQGIFDVIKDPINQVNLQKPISMDEQHEAGDLSTLGKEEKYMTFDNPATKFKMQIQNMVGREVIGVTAVSLKAFFAASLYYNSEMESIAKLVRDQVTPENIQEVWTKIQDLVYDNKFGNNVELKTLSNAYIRPILLALQANPNWNVIKISDNDVTSEIDLRLQSKLLDFLDIQSNGTYLNFAELMVHLNESANRNDAPMSISGLLSAATDNAKELILAKINATTKFADIYTYLLSTGESFNDIAKFMISPIFNIVSKYANDNIFDASPKNIRLLDALQFVLNEKTLPMIDNFVFNNWMLYTGYQSVSNNYDRFEVSNKSLLAKILFKLNDNGVNTTELNPYTEPLIDKILIAIGAQDISTPQLKYQAVVELIQNLKAKWGEGISGETRQLIVKTILDELSDPKIGNYLRTVIINHIKSQINTESSSNTRNINDDWYDEIDSIPEWDPYNDDTGLYEEMNNANLSEVVFNIEDISSDQYRQLYRYFNDYLFKKEDQLNALENKENSLNQLDELRKKVLPGAKELQLLGRFLGINQGMKTNDFQEYSWIKNLESEINRIYVEAGKDEEFMPFDLLMFMENPQYRQKQIDQYEQVKTTFNILKVITTASNFFEMLRMLVVARKSLYQSAAVRLERQFAREVIEAGEKTHRKRGGESEARLLITSADTSSVNQKEFREISNYVQDVLILNWIATLKGRTFTIPKGGTKYFNDGKSTNNTETKEERTISLNSTAGLATFKNWMENTIIPRLKELNDQGYFSSGPNANRFIKGLTSGFSTNQRLNSIRTFYTLPIQMNKVADDLKTQELYNGYLDDFSLIANKKLPNDIFAADDSLVNYPNMQSWTIGELFFLYNTIVHKNSMSSDSLSRIFVDLNTQNDYGIIRSWHTFVSKLDEGEISLNDLAYDRSMKDLKYRLSDQKTKLKFKVQDRYENGKLVAVDFYNFNDSKDVTSIGVRKDIYYSDFTFNMPYMDSEKLESPISSQSLINEYNQDYKPALNDKEVIQEIINSFNRLTQFTTRIRIKTITNEELDSLFKAEQDGKNSPITFGSIDVLNRMKGSNSFISNQTIYINMSNPKASSPIHEYMHVVLASMKFSKDEATKNKFYDILNAIKQTPEYQKTLEDVQKAEYNLKGSDLQEEVLVHLLEKEFLNGFENKWDNPILKDLKQSVVSLIEQLLGIDSISDQNLDNLGSTSIQDLMLFFSSKLISTSETLDDLAIPLNQTIANIKATLAKNSQITWKNC